MLQKVISINRGLGGKVLYTCVGSKPWTALTPEKHTFMTHNAQTVYDEPVPHGVFPLVPGCHMQDSLQYMSQIQQITHDHLRSIYPNYRAVNDTTLVDPQLETWWTSLGVKDFEGESEQLLYKLATGIVVKESKLNWVKEQQRRFEQSVKGGSGVYLQPFRFYYMYNRLLWRLVEESHNFESPAVRGYTSQTYLNLLSDLRPAPVIPSLVSGAPENNTFLNRLLVRLHK